MKLLFTKNYCYLIFCLVLFISGCTPPKPIKGAVVSAREEASAIGVAIMQQGGTAFDAMIATDLALTVCYPNAGNISGGGFFYVSQPLPGKSGALDYREKAPLGASSDMYLDEEGNIVPNKSTLGGLSVGVPGTVAGLVAIHKKFGSLAWEDLVQTRYRFSTRGIPSY